MVNVFANMSTTNILLLLLALFLATNDCAAQQFKSSSSTVNVLVSQTLACCSTSVGNMHRALHLVVVIMVR